MCPLCSIIINNNYYYYSDINFYRCFRIDTPTVAHFCFPHGVPVHWLARTKSSSSVHELMFSALQRIEAADHSFVFLLSTGEHFLYLFFSFVMCDRSFVFLSIVFVDTFATNFLFSFECVSESHLGIISLYTDVFPLFYVFLPSHRRAFSVSLCILCAPFFWLLLHIKSHLRKIKLI